MKPIGSYPLLVMEVWRVEWPHCLDTVVVSTLNHGAKSCDLDGYNIIPIWMVEVVNDDKKDDD